MLNLVPDIERLTHIFSQATAPTFFLGAVAAFVSLMSSRLNELIGRMRNLNEITEDDPARAHLKVDLERLRYRARLLSSGITMALRSGICATLLLAFLFSSEYLGLKYAYGAGPLFLLATILLGIALFRFSQEAAIGLNALDEHN